MISYAVPRLDHCLITSFMNELENEEEEEDLRIDNEVRSEQTAHPLLRCFEQARVRPN